MHFNCIDLSCSVLRLLQTDFSWRITSKKTNIASTRIRLDESLVEKANAYCKSRKKVKNLEPYGYLINGER